MLVTGAGKADVLAYDAARMRKASDAPEDVHVARLLGALTVVEHPATSEAVELALEVGGGRTPSGRVEIEGVPAIAWRPARYHTSSR